MAESGRPPVMGEWSPDAHIDWLTPEQRKEAGFDEEDAYTPAEYDTHLKSVRANLPPLERAEIQKRLDIIMAEDIMAKDTVAVSMHDFAFGLANLIEAHEELCRVYDRSGFVVVGEALEHLRSCYYMLTGE